MKWAMPVEMRWTEIQTNWTTRTEHETMASADEEVNSITVDKADHFYRKSELYNERKGKPHLEIEVDHV